MRGPDGKMAKVFVYSSPDSFHPNYRISQKVRKFVKNHHQKIKKIAAVTGSSFLSIMPQVANHFVQAEVRHFDYDDKDTAVNWLTADKLEW